MHRFRWKSAFAAAAAGAAVVLGAGTALAAGGWTVVAAPPTGQNAALTGVATVSGSDAWLVGFQALARRQRGPEHPRELSTETRSWPGGRRNGRQITVRSLYWHLCVSRSGAMGRPERLLRPAQGREG
jgi:hypothetical protein